MDSHMQMNLRRPTGKELNVNRHNSQELRRNQRRTVMRDILCRNFFRRFMCNPADGDEKNIRVEKDVAIEIGKLVDQKSDIPAPVLARFEQELAAKFGLLKKKSKAGQHQMVHLRNGDTRGRQTPLGSLPNLNVDICEKDVTLPAISTQPKHASQFDLNRNDEQRSNMNGSRYGGSYNRNINQRQHYTINPSLIQKQSHRSKHGASVDLNEQPANVYSNSLSGKGGNGMAPSLRNNNYVNVRQSMKSGSYHQQRDASPLEELVKGSGRNTSDMGNISSARNPGKLNITLKSNRRRQNMIASIAAGSVKIGQEQSQRPLAMTIDDLPSDISADEWGEVQKYGHILHIEAKRKEQTDKAAKIAKVKEVLDQQVITRKQLAVKHSAEKKEIDNKILDLARAEQEDEKKKMQDLRVKVLEQKKMREIMIHEAAARRINEKNKQSQIEKDMVHKLQADIATENNQRAQKKADERSNALKVIRENEQKQRKRQDDYLKQKENDAVAIREIMKTQEEKEKKRAEEMAVREGRIKKIMEGMGDQIFQKDKDMQIRQEKEYIAECIQKDNQAQKQDQNKRISNKRKHQEMLQFLDNQMSDKRQRHDAELEGNKLYMNEWNAKMDHAGREATDKDKLRREAQLANQKFLRQQIDDKSGQTASGSPQAHTIRKMVIGGQMNNDEVKMNRQLLKEIADKKRLQSVTEQSGDKKSKLYCSPGRSNSPKII